MRIFLASLGILCDRSHQHESWKQRWIDGKLFFSHSSWSGLSPCDMQTHGYILVPGRSLYPCETLQKQLSLDLGTGSETYLRRKAKLKQFLGEYGSTVKAAVPLGFQQLDKILKDFPKGTKVVHRQLKWGYMRDDWINKISWTGRIEEGAHFELVTLGIPRCPETFMKEANEAGHPRHPFKIRAKRA